jgi:hypothetical protein
LPQHKTARTVRQNLILGKEPTPARLAEFLRDRRATLFLPGFVVFIAGRIVASATANRNRADGLPRLRLCLRYGKPVKRKK